MTEVSINRDYGFNSISISEVLTSACFLFPPLFFLYFGRASGVVEILLADTPNAFVGLAHRSRIFFFFFPFNTLPLLVLYSLFMDAHVLRQLDMLTDSQDVIA